MVCSNCASKQPAGNRTTPARQDAAIEIGNMVETGHRVG
jgi:hypothetical protein